MLNTVARSCCLCPCSLAVPVLAGWVYAFVVLCLGTPEGSTGIGSGFKALHYVFSSNPNGLYIILL